MKKLLTVAVVISLSGLLVVTGCKDAEPSIGAQPSEDIFGGWKSTNALDTGDFIIEPGALFFIIEDGNNIVVEYDAYVVGGDSTHNTWSGTIVPDPSTSVNLTITVNSSRGTYAPPINEIIYVSYVLTSSTTGVFTMDGYSFNVIRYIAVPK
ncbi:MAG: hypothetical protein RQ801_07565 [Spirochaetaceae bacterium]|nr:hypothetical protein [Spirochaetaceae bacterium]MDT8298139.1 hypothetical protein [Spirochaetaceae bacterium]